MLQICNVLLSFYMQENITLYIFMVWIFPSEVFISQ